MPRVPGDEILSTEMRCGLENDYRRRLAWPVALVAVITIASGGAAAPVVPGAVSGIPHFDKVVHFFVFGLLATLVLRAFSRENGYRLAATIAVLVTSAFGLADELHQSTNPVRHFSWLDWMADTAGAVVAVSVYLGWARYRTALEMPLRVPQRREAALSAGCAGDTDRTAADSDPGRRPGLKRR